MPTKDNLISQSPDDFDYMQLSVASASMIESWSYGEVTKPETINYRTQKPEREGLFDEKIFGPTKDFECYCGKYKKIRFKGVICDKCGVEVTHSSVRRERMGHIKLAIPVAHTWYVRGIPSIIGQLIGMSSQDLERVIYFASFVILELKAKEIEETLKDLDDEYKQLKSAGKISPELENDYREGKNLLKKLTLGQLLSEADFHEISMRYGNIIRVGTGAEALAEILENIDIKSELKKETRLLQTAPPGAMHKIMRRITMLEAMDKSHIKPIDLILKNVPVIPPDLRPMVQLDGGRFAASDLNDLYRRVLNRNNRLKKLQEAGAPEVITRNEKRMLQEAVDALIDNQNRRSRSAQTSARGTRKLRSLSDMLRGKQGRFRQNLLGKRVDYSGRSVIVSGPELKLDQCGLPKIIALELYKPYVISKLISEGYVHNVKNASRLIEEKTPEVYDILERVSKDSVVLLNRAPTLHRLGIQGFHPVLIEGKAIQVHPLVCYAFNADFDGDQMAVHLPLSPEAIKESEEIILSSQNLLKPASGEPVVHARYDIVFGCFWLTTYRKKALGTGKLFSSKNEAILAYQTGILDPRAKIKVRFSEGEIIETSVGRILFNNILPEKKPFLNKKMDNKALKKLIIEIYRDFGSDETVKFVDKMKSVGLHYAGISGLTISISDIEVPQEKAQIIKDNEKKAREIDDLYKQGLITKEERDFKTVELWNMVKDDIEEKMVKEYKSDNPVYQMVASGARGSFAQILQMGGMKGLVVSPTGEIITLPVKASFKEGLEDYEYFLSTHGARKGKSDTSLRTSDAGYLTRRLVDVAQEMIINSKDCGTKEGLTITKESALQRSFSQRIFGRVLLKGVKLASGKRVSKSTIITKDIAKTIERDKMIKEVIVRSPATCLNEYGICQNCYGLDLASSSLIKEGEAAGIIAAQAIGEPGTQLTMRTFHLGGVSGEDITTGLPRVEELFEARVPKRPAILAEKEGIIRIVQSSDRVDLRIETKDEKTTKIEIPKGFELVIKDGDKVRLKQIIASKKDAQPIRAPLAGVAKVNGKNVSINGKKSELLEYSVSKNTEILVNNGEKVEKGQALTEGQFDLSQSLKLRGATKTQQYIVDEVQKIYQAQGQEIDDKHIELIVKQMFSKIIVTNPGDSKILEGQIVDKHKAVKERQQLIKKGKKPLQFKPIIMGITRISLKTESFLSAASFQQTTSVLVDAAIRGAIDELKGPKENVIIGRLIPAGTGYRKRK